MRKKILLAKPIRDHNPQSLLDFVRTLYKRNTESKESKAVPGITCHFGNRIIIKLKDKDRIFTDEEIKLLAMEYEKEFDLLLNELLKRSIKVINSKGEFYGKPRKQRASQGDAIAKRKTRKKASENKLLEPGSVEYLLQESPLPVEHES